MCCSNSGKYKHDEHEKIMLSSKSKSSKKNKKIFDYDPPTYYNNLDFEDNKKLQKAIHKKPKCMFHKDEKIKNFCINEQCLMPLCSLCLEDHINKHNDLQTKPQIKTFEEVKMNIIYKLNELNEIIKEDSEQLNMFRNNYNHSNLYQELENHRNKIHQAVDSYFIKMKALLDEKLKIHQINNGSKIDELQKFLDLNNQNLKSYHNLILEKGSKSLKHLILFQKYNIYDESIEFSEKLKETINSIQLNNIKLIETPFEIEKINDLLSQYLQINEFDHTKIRMPIHIPPPPPPQFPINSQNFQTINPQNFQTRIYSTPPQNINNRIPLNSTVPVIRSSNNGAHSPYLRIESPYQSQNSNVFSSPAQVRGLHGSMFLSLNNWR